MSKLSVAEAAEQFKVSKEAIHNRIRRGSLDCVIEHGVKYVLIDEPASATKVPENDKYYSYIEDENRALKEKVIDLEKQNIRLRDQKEIMLIEEKKKIEQIYKERDEQLKQVLHTITSKFLPHIEQKLVDETASDIVDVEEVRDNKEAYSEPIRLKRFLKLKAYKPAKRQRIKNRFKRLVGRDERVVRTDGKIYIDPIKYDYKDLLE
jgi:predicted DNA-binding protein YlxM (UPF0122 family)